jgi:hypothetical protein
MAAGFDIINQPIEGPGAPDYVVTSFQTVEADPDGIGPAVGERQLGVGGDRGGIKADFFGQFYQSVKIIKPVAPKERLAAFEIDEARSEPIRV